MWPELWMVWFLIEWLLKMLMWRWTQSLAERPCFKRRGGGSFFSFFLWADYSSFLLSGFFSFLSFDQSSFCKAQFRLLCFIEGPLAYIIFTCAVQLCLESVSLTSLLLFFSLSTFWQWGLMCWCQSIYSVFFLFTVIKLLLFIWIYYFLF